MLTGKDPKEDEGDGVAEEPAEMETPTTAFLLCFDGAFSPSRRYGAGGVVLLDSQGKEVWAKGKVFLDAETNNVAEYKALIWGLEECMQSEVKEIEVRGDSQLVIKQMKGIYKTRSPHLQELWQHAMDICKRFEFCKFKHVSRKDNHKADELATCALKEEVIVALIDTGWPQLHDVETYVENGVFPKGLSSQQKQRLERKARPYTVMGDTLYKMGKDMILRRVVSPEESQRILKMCHDCSGHYALVGTMRKILNSGYSWPRMHKDVYEWCKTCEVCQKFGRKDLIPGPLRPVPAYGPFERWGLDFVGPLPRSSSGKYFLIVATDYATRWAEAKATIGNNAITVASFLIEFICSRFGCPLEILTDGGSSFRNDLIDRLVQKLSINHRVSSPYYPQCNGLVERTNGLLCNSLGKLVDEKKRRWDKHVPEALWAYRTTHKLAIGFTPFQLVYGVEALLPIELEIQSLRTVLGRKDDVEESYAQRLVQLEVLDERRLQALQNLEAAQQRQKARFDKKRRKKREIKEGDLVLRFDSRLDKQLNKKLMRRWEGPFRVWKKHANNSYSLEDIHGCEVPGRTNEYRLKIFFPRVSHPADPLA